MARVRIQPSDLQKELRARARQMPKMIAASQRRAAQRGRVRLVRQTPVDRGQMKNAWRVTKGKRTRIVNDAPYAGVVERGARPHRVNQAGRESLEDWARRKLGVSRKEARSVAFAIAKKLEKEGQKGLFIVEEALPELRRLVVEEFQRRLRQAAKRRASGRRGGR